MLLPTHFWLMRKVGVPNVNSFSVFVHLKSDKARLVLYSVQCTVHTVFCIRIFFLHALPSIPPHSFGVSVLSYVLVILTTSWITPPCSNVGLENVRFWFLSTLRYLHLVQQMHNWGLLLGAFSMITGWLCAQYETSHDPIHLLWSEVAKTVVESSKVLQVHTIRCRIWMSAIGTATKI